MKRCFVCFKVFDQDSVKIPDEYAREYKWWSKDLAEDTFKDHPETPGICSVECLKKFFDETNQR
jgi:hypothetical protein